jgi:hypothetical protein
MVVSPDPRGDPPHPAALAGGRCGVPTRRPGKGTFFFAYFFGDVYVTSAGFWHAGRWNHFFPPTGGVNTRGFFFSPWGLSGVSEKRAGWWVTRANEIIYPGAGKPRGPEPFFVARGGPRYRPALERGV